MTIKSNTVILVRKHTDGDHFLDKHIAHEADYPVLFYLKVGVMMTISMKIFLTMATTSRACSPPTFPPTPQVLPSFLSSFFSSSSSHSSIRIFQGRPLWLPHCVDGKSLNFCDAVCSGEEVKCPRYKSDIFLSFSGRRTHVVGL